MKRKSFILPVVFLFASVLFSCTDEKENLIETNNTDIEYIELTAEEVVLKNQLAEAAKIVAEITADKEVLNEIVSTIKVQPRVMEDRAKFADLMNPEMLNKSATMGINKGKFASAFQEKLSQSRFKSANTLIESLCSQGIELYIPYPIEDYPEGTDVIVTSTPMDNEVENIGFFVGQLSKTIIVNQQLTETYPVIIITPSVVSSEQIKAASQLNDIRTKHKSASIDPMSVWDNTAYTFTLFIDYVYIKNDYVANIFQPEGNIYYASGGLSFNSSNS